MWGDKAIYAAYAYVAVIFLDYVVAPLFAVTWTPLTSQGGPAFHWLIGLLFLILAGEHFRYHYLLDKHKEAEVLARARKKK